MPEIKVILLDIGSTRCCYCGKQAEKNVGGNYDVCDSLECMEIALEDKADDLAEVSRTWRDLMGQSIYENRMDR